MFKNFLAPIKGWRTVMLNVVLALIPLIEEFGLGDYVPDRYMVWYVLAVIALNLAARLMTTTPVGKSL